jgi:hypothetical protein
MRFIIRPSGIIIGTIVETLLASFTKEVVLILV